MSRLAIVVALMLLGLTLALAVPRPAAAEDLLDIYRQARAADPVLAAAEAQRGVREELAAQARAALLPQWSLAADGSRATAEGTQQRILSSQLSQALFDLGRLRALDAARTEVSAQQARLAAAEQELCARVARGYFGVLLAQAGVATAEANEAALATQVAQTQSRFAAGLTAQVDVQQSRAAHELARTGSTLARQALAEARAALAQVTGQPAGTLKPLAAELPALPPEPAQPEAWVQRTLAAHPLLQAQQIGVAAGEQRILAARAAHWPTLSLGLDSERRSPVAVDGSRSDTAVALRLRVPLFAGGATQSLVRQAGYERDAQKADLESLRRALSREARSQFEAVMAGLATLQSTGAAVAAASQALASTRAGQALGTRSNTDLLFALQTQASAQNAHEQARHGYVLARLLLLQAAGQLGEGELAVVNRLLIDAPTEGK